MATEIIYAEDHGRTASDDDGKNKRVIFDTRMEVRSHEHGVEVGMVWPTEDGNYGDPGIENGARRVFGGFDRQALNRMIRELRKARDRAYGKDE